MKKRFILLNAIKRQWHPKRLAYAVVGGAIVFWITAGIFTVFSIASERLKKEYYENAPIEWFIKIEKVQLRYIGDTKDSKVVNQTLFKDVRVPVRASVRREYICSFPEQYGLYDRPSGGFFDIDKYEETFDAQGNLITDEKGNPIKKEQPTVTVPVRIPRTEEVDACQTMYSRNYYDIMLPNGYVRVNAYVITSNTIKIKPDEPIIEQIEAINERESTTTITRDQPVVIQNYGSTSVEKESSVTKEEENKPAEKGAVGKTLEKVEERVEKATKKVDSLVKGVL